MGSAADETEYQILSAAQRQFSDTVEEGCIISQTPEAGNGATMTKGTAIVVVVSQGPQLRPLPQITGRPLAGAAPRVADAGVVPSKTVEYSDTVPAGCAVGYQEGSAGDQMLYGSQVTIVISLGPEHPEPSQPASEPGDSLPGAAE